VASVLDALFIADPLTRFDPRADSTHVMIKEALRRGHRPWHATLSDLSLHGPEARAACTPLRMESDLDDARISPAGPPEQRTFAEFDAVLMRKDPPVDENYMIATWCMDRAQGQTVLVNDPQGLRDVNEKLAILEFPDLIPETRLLRRESDLRETLREFGGRMIVKPVYGFGGSEILQAREGDPNLSTIFEVATHLEARWTVAQAFLEEAHEGDKRILLVDGVPIGAVMRVPARGELRNNFHAGGSPARTELNERDREICARVGPYLRERGQFFAGIDVIGGHLTEINVTSPTGMQEINRLEERSSDTTTQAVFWDALESKCATATMPGA
jgi:glutathione synthase